MLAKSKTSALILGTITVLSFAAVIAASYMLIPYLRSGDIAVIADPQLLSTSASITLVVVLTIFPLALLIAATAFWQYKFFGPAYYGSRGAWRWALFGVVLGLLVQVPDWFSPYLAWLGSDAVNFIWRILSLLIAFFISRKLVPLRQAQPIKS
ncbi:MAG: hypothetical protein AB1894_10885 [Chloroflexota bacterium]